MKSGDSVKILDTDKTGVIKKRLISPEDTIQYLVAFTARDGEAHERYFEEHEIEVVEPEPPAPAA